MNKPTKFTLEQEFNLRSFDAQVLRMSREQAQEYLVKLYRLMLAQKAVFQELLKRNGISR